MAAPHLSDLERLAMEQVWEDYLGERVDAEGSRLLEDSGELALVQFARQVDALRFHVPPLIAGTHPAVDRHTVALALQSPIACRRRVHGSRR